MIAEPDESSATGEEGSVTGLYDHRIVSKPGKIPKDKAKWLEWKFDFENFMTLVRAQYADEMAQAAVLNEMINDTGSSAVRQRSTLLYAILGGLAQDKSKTIIRSLKVSRNGFEAWRQIVADYEPQNENRKLALSLRIAQGKAFEGIASKDFAVALMNWEEEINEYEAMSNPPVPYDDALKRAVLMSRAPKVIQDHLRVNPGVDTYKKMRDAVEGYLRLT